MKKLICSFILLAAVLGVHGQGRIAFANGSTTPITNASTGLVISGANNFYFGLYVGSVGTPAGGLVLNILATNTAIAGRLTGGNPAPVAAPFADGSAIAFQIRGWSAAGGLTYEEAVIAQQSNPNILLGVSILGQVTPTLTPTAAASIFGTTGGGLVPGFTLNAVPEPSSIALGVLGLGAIALFRRKK